MDLRKTIGDLLNESDDMNVTVGKRVLKLQDAPPIVQVRWFKQRLQEIEAKLAPAPKPKTEKKESAQPVQVG